MQSFGKDNERTDEIFVPEVHRVRCVAQTYERSCGDESPSRLERNRTVDDRRHARSGGYRAEPRKTQARETLEARAVRGDREQADDADRKHRLGTAHAAGPHERGHADACQELETERASKKFERPRAAHRTRRLEGTRCNDPGGD